MDKLNRVFEQTFGLTYKEWHKTEFYTAEKEYVHAKRVYRHDPKKCDKWNAAKYRYKRAINILETYEGFELLFSTK